MPTVKTPDQILAEMVAHAKFGRAVLRLAREYGLIKNPGGRPMGYSPRKAKPNGAERPAPPTNRLGGPRAERERPERDRPMSSRTVEA